MTYVDREEKFTVPGNRTDAVLERLVESNLRIEGVLEDDESVTGSSASANSRSSSPSSESSSTSAATPGTATSRCTTTTT